MLDLPQRARFRLGARRKAKAGRPRDVSAGDSDPTCLRRWAVSGTSAAGEEQALRSSGRGLRALFATPVRFPRGLSPRLDAPGPPRPAPRLLPGEPARTGTAAADGPGDGETSAAVGQKRSVREADPAAAQRRFADTGCHPPDWPATRFRRCGLAQIFRLPGLMPRQHGL